MQSASGSKRVASLDAIRGLAVLLVFVFHYFLDAAGPGAVAFKGEFRDFDLWPGYSDWLLYPLTLGWVGVSIFFVLSGFVIHLAHGGYERDGLVPYLRRRFWRIYPTYFFVLVFLAFAWTRPGERPIVQFVTHALLIHDLSPETQFGANPSFWSIAVEAQFYLLYPLVMRWRARFGLGRVLLALAVLNLVLRLGTTLTCDVLHLAGDGVRELIMRSPLTLWADWVLGAYVAEAFLAGRRAFPKRLVRFGVPLAVIGVVATSLSRSSFFYGFSIASFGAALVIDVVAHRKTPAGRVERMFVPLGLVGYSFYLIHQPALVEMRRLASRWSGDRPVETLDAVLIFMVIFCVSWVVYQLLERPTQQMGRPRLAAVEALTPA